MRRAGTAGRRLTGSGPTARPVALARLVGLAGVAGLVALTGLGLSVAAAPAALADGSSVSPSVTGPDNNTTYKADQSVEIDGSVAFGSSDSGTFTLSLADPYYAVDPSTGCSWTLKSVSYDGSSGSSPMAATADVDLSKAYADSCTGLKGFPAANGTWTVTATAGGQTDTRKFTVAVPPAAPQSVQGSSPASGAVAMTWAQDPEPDTHAYAVVDSTGAVVGQVFDAAKICSGGTCSATVTAQAGGAQSFAVRAFRYSAPPAKATTATTGDLHTDSAAVSVTVTAPAASPTPSASAAPGGSTPTPKATAPAVGGTLGPGSTSLTGISGIGTTGIGSTGSGGQGPQFSSVGSGLPPIPVLGKDGKPVATSSAQAQAGSSAAPDDGEPTDDGTYKLSLGYSPEQKTVTTKTVHTPLNFVADAVGVTPVSLWESIAGALVLLLAAAHVRRWARQPIE